MDYEYLLYIDILGFSNMCCELDERVNRIYDIIFEMRTHGSQVYDITIFSDTVLVRNRGRLDDRSHVQFLVEFFQVIELRLSEINVYTRGVMCFERFHCELREDVPIAYGPAVVAANRAERRINGLGLYLCSSCHEHCVDYDTLRLEDENLYYLFTLKAFRRIREVSFSENYIPTEILEDTDDFCRLPEQVRFLKRIHSCSIDESLDERFRSKYQNVIDMYLGQYQRLVNRLIESDFEVECINSDFDWTVYGN